MLHYLQRVSIAVARANVDYAKMRTTPTQRPFRGYGNYIRQFRKAKEWSPKDLADHMGTSKGTVDNLELERIEPSYEQVRALQLHLKLSAAHLIELVGLPLDVHPQARLPGDLVRDLMALSPARQVGLIEIAQGWLRIQEESQ